MTAARLSASRRHVPLVARGSGVLGLRQWATRCHHGIGLTWRESELLRVVVQPRAVLGGLLWALLEGGWQWFSGLSLALSIGWLSLPAAGVTSRGLCPRPSVSLNSGLSCLWMFVSETCSFHHHASGGVRGRRFGCDGQREPAPSLPSLCPLAVLRLPRALPLKLLN